MQNLYKVKCTPNEHGIKIKIICTSPHKLQITIKECYFNINFMEITS